MHNRHVYCTLPHSMYCSIRMQKENDKKLCDKIIKKSGLKFDDNWLCHLVKNLPLYKGPKNVETNYRNTAMRYG